MVTEGISFYSIQKRKGKEKVGQNQGLQVTQIVVVCCHKASVGQSDGHLMVVGWMVVGSSEDDNKQHLIKTCKAIVNRFVIRSLTGVGCTSRDQKKIIHFSSPIPEPTPNCFESLNICALKSAI